MNGLKVFLGSDNRILHVLARVSVGYKYIVYL